LRHIYDDPVNNAIGSRRRWTAGAAGPEPFAPGWLLPPTGMIYGLHF